MFPARLPEVNAVLNALAGVWLLAGYYFIRHRRIAAHRTCMLGAFTTSILFLAGYLTYHFLAGTNRFHTQGWIRGLYLGILGTHTVLAAALVPLVLITLTRGLRRRYARHRRIARWTWPVWMYVSVTGVVVYLMLYRLDPALSGLPVGAGPAITAPGPAVDPGDDPGR